MGAAQVRESIELTLCPIGKATPARLQLILNKDLDLAVLFNHKAKYRIRESTSHRVSSVGYFEIQETYLRRIYHRRVAR